MSWLALKATVGWLFLLGLAGVLVVMLSCESEGSTKESQSGRSTYPHSITIATSRPCLVVSHGGNASGCGDDEQERGAWWNSQHGCQRCISNEQEIGLGPHSLRSSSIRRFRLEYNFMFSAFHCIFALKKASYILRRLVQPHPTPWNRTIQFVFLKMCPILKVFVLSIKHLRSCSLTCRSLYFGDLTNVY